MTGIDSLRSLSKSKKRHYVGQVVDVLYDPESPYTSLRFSDSSPAVWIIIFAGTGALSLLLGLLFALTLR